MPSVLLISDLEMSTAMKEAHLVYPIRYFLRLIRNLLALTSIKIHSIT